MSDDDSSSSSASNNSNNNNSILYTITARDLLQANATIISGVLILLTITVSFDRTFTFWEVILLSIGTLPFVFSCVLLLEEHWTREYGYKAAKHITYFGLFGLFIVIIYFLGLSQRT